MALLAQTSYTIKRIPKENYRFDLSAETIVLPADSSGVVTDYSGAKVELKLSYDGKEIYPNYDDAVEGRNLYLNSEPERTSTREYVSYPITGIIRENSGKELTYSLDVKIPIAGSIDFYSTGNHSVGFYKSFTLKANVWTRITAIGIAEYNMADQSSYCNLSIYGTYDTGRIPICRRLKISRNNTDYSPAPEDFDSQITSSLITKNCTATVANGILSITNLTADAGYVDVTIDYGVWKQTKRLTIAKSKQGNDGKSITLVDVEFGVSAHKDVHPTVWTTTAPTLTGSQQLWTRTKTIYSAGNPTYTNPANITPKTGETGAIGTGIESVTEEYAISTSKTVQPTSGWSTAQPTWSQGNYIWSRVKVVYKNPTSTIYTGYAVSSEWEAVNDLEIGGRNLLKQSSVFLMNPNVYGSGNSVLMNDETEPYMRATPAAGQTVSLYGLSFVLGQSQYVQGIYVRQNSGAPVEISLYRSNTSTHGGKITLIPSGVWTYITTNTIIGRNLSTPLLLIVQSVPTISLDYKKAKLEDGNKPTSWTEAPEDTQAKIDEAKTQITAVNTSLGNLNTYVDGAFRDGVIDSAEAKSIEQLIKTVQAENDKIIATYNQLFLNNSYLTGTARTSLEQNKITFVGAVSNVISAINTAIVDGKITPAERNNVNTRFNEYKSALASFSTAIENANKAIQDKINQNAQDAIDGIEIGGRNLLRNTSSGWKAVTTTNFQYVENFFKDTVLEANQSYTFSWEAELVSGIAGGVVHIGCGNTGYQLEIYRSPIPIIGKGSITFKPTSSDLSTFKSFAFRWYNNYNVFTFKYRNLKLEKGNKPTDWTEAPEDVQARTDEIEIGGANLSGNISQYALGAGWTRSGETLSNITSSTFNHCQSPSFNIAAGKKYIISFYVDEIVGQGAVQIVENIQHSYKVFKGLNVYSFTSTANAVAHIRVFGDTSTRYTIREIKVNEALSDRVEKEKQRINDIFNDNMADPSEKQYLSNLWQEIYAEYPRIWAQGFNYGINVNYYEGAYVALRNILTPILADLTINTTVSGASIRTAFSQYYDARTVLQNNITNKVSQNAQAAADAAAQAAATAQAKANQAAAVTDKFGTTANGGLISTVMMLLRELNSTKDTAGLSGIQGALKNNPAYWAGGTYEQAFALINFLSKMSAGTSPNAGEYARLAKITMLHNGAAKIGDFIVEESGRIALVDPANGKTRLVFNATNIPKLADLLGSTIWKGDIPMPQTGVGTDSDIILAQNLIIEKDNSEINFTASLLDVSATSLIGGDGIIPSAEVSVYLFRNNVHFSTLAQVTAVPYWGETVTESLSNINRTIQGCPAGTYKIILSLAKTSGIIGAFGNISSSNFKWEFKQSGVRYFQFGLDGMMAFFSENHIHFSETDGWSVRGKSNMPGVLLSTTVSSTGIFANTWGAKKHASLSASKVSTGTYDIYHSIGHSTYNISANAYGNRTISIVSKSADRCRIQIYNGTTLIDGQFDITLTGNNY